MNTCIPASSAVDSELHRALAQDELLLHYQPQVNTHSKLATGVEALLRWQHPRLGLLLPERFIPQAECSGLIIPIWRWVLHRACAQYVAWQDAGLPSLPIAINLSARQFGDDHLLRHVVETVSEFDIDPHHLVFEVTESTVVGDLSRAIGILKDIRALGIRVALDDFGTGCSSLSLLKHFPVDVIKIDRSFIHDLPHDRTDEAITSAIIDMGKRMGVTVVAEGVETWSQWRFLRDQGCDEIQGHLFSKALSADALARFAGEQTRDPLVPKRIRYNPVTAMYDAASLA